MQDEKLFFEWRNNRANESEIVLLILEIPFH